MRDIERWAQVLGIANFRGVFMREALPTGSPHKGECGIINLGSLESGGTHWTCYMTLGDSKIYFDSYGDAEPPLELVRYLGDHKLKYNSYGFQTYDDPPICGHLCLHVLSMFSCGRTWDQIEDSLLHDKYGWMSWYIRN